MGWELAPKHQPQPGKKPRAKLIYGALTAANGPVWLAADQGLFEKYGLDVQIIHGRGATPVKANTSNAMEFGHYAGVQVVAANLLMSSLFRDYVASVRPRGEPSRSRSMVLCLAGHHPVLSIAGRA